MTRENDKLAKRADAATWLIIVLTAIGAVYINLFKFVL